MSLKQTPLASSHKALGARMVPFAGYEMPVRYISLVEEHLAVRNKVGLFDVSHMGEFIVSGPSALELIQKTTSNDVSKLGIGQAQYSCLPNSQGGIVDDLLVYRLEDNRYMLVVNASNIEKDYQWLNQHNTMGAELENISDTLCLLAVQGPLASQTLQAHTPVNLDSLKYYTFTIGDFAGVQNVIISATGYTGSGGFELYIPLQHAQLIWDKIMQSGKDFGLIPVGLGARDTLRLEKGYCLYGNDITDDTSPLEAGLGWITKFTKDFIGSGLLQEQKDHGVSRKLIGFVMDERGIPRKDYQIANMDGKVIGIVTSGTQSPCLETGIGLGYVSIEYCKPGTDIYILIRNKSVKATIKKLPLV